MRPVSEDSRWCCCEVVLSKVQGSSWWLVYYTIDHIWHKDKKWSKSEMQGIVSAKIMATHSRKCMAILQEGLDIYQCDWDFPTD